MRIENNIQAKISRKQQKLLHNVKIETTEFFESMIETLRKVIEYQGVYINM